jgi:hypothetical protein
LVVVDEHELCANHYLTNFSKTDRQ